MPEQFAAQSPNDLPDLPTVLSMTGLEFIAGIRDGTIAGPPIATVMNTYIHEVEKGRVAFRGTPEFQHFNPMGGVHGGWYGTILDSAMACAVATILPKGSIYTTLEYKVNLTRALKPGALVECVGTVQHSGRSTAVAQGTIIGVEDGKLYGTGSTTCIIMQP